MSLVSHSIGNNIRKCRIKRELTQAQLAEALAVTRQTVTNYENGKSKPDIDMLLHISDVLDVDLDQLIYGHSDEQTKKQKRQAVKTTMQLAALALLLIAVLRGAYYLRSLYYVFAFNLVFLVRLVMVPICMFLFGWGGIKIVQMISGIQVRVGRYSKIGYMVLIGTLICNAAIIVPYVLFYLVALIMELAQVENIDLTFPPIPVYQSIAFFLIKVQCKYYFVYIFMGAAAKLLCVQGKLFDGRGAGK